MAMFGFLGLDKSVTVAAAAVSAAGGALVGAGAAHVYHKITTGGKIKRLEERLGDVDDEARERAVKKIAILTALAHRDGSLHAEEKLFLYRYILSCPHLPADLKVSLGQELEEPPPTALSEIWTKIREVIRFSDLFKTDEEAAGFVQSMLQLAKADGQSDSSEMDQINKVCADCKIPAHLLPANNTAMQN